MSVEEITLEKLDPGKFIEEQCSAIAEQVAGGLAINALSGGVDSSVVTMLGHRAIGDRLLTYFIDNGIMRREEPAKVAAMFEKLGVPIEIVDAREPFFSALKGLSDPEEKREAITQTFYRDVFGDLVRKSGARFLLQGTIFTDVEETVAGVKRQHNILSQLGIDTREQFGYTLIEPLIRLRKPGVRKIGEALGLPRGMFDRPPFPGPALAARVIGETTPDRVELVREATAIVEEELAGVRAFQYLAILHEDKVTGIRDGKRDYGHQIEVRCWDSTDAKTATPTRLDYDVLERIASRITTEVKGVVSVTYNISSKPTSTIEAV